MENKVDKDIEGKMEDYRKNMKERDHYREALEDFSDSIKEKPNLLYRNYIVRCALDVVLEDEELLRQMALNLATEGMKRSLL